MALQWFDNGSTMVRQRLDSTPTKPRLNPDKTLDSTPTKPRLNSDKTPTQPRLNPDESGRF